MNIISCTGFGNLPISDNNISTTKNAIDTGGRNIFREDANIDVRNMREGELTVCLSTKYIVPEKRCKTQGCKLIHVSCSCCCCCSCRCGVVGVVP